jgi:NADPH-dependent ferric siderophore reductase
LDDNGDGEGHVPEKDLKPTFDVCNSYMLVTDEARIPELEAILREFKAKTTQEAIYLEIQRNVDVRFI